MSPNPIQGVGGLTSDHGRCLKELCHKIFDFYFFHYSNPSGPLINKVKYFQIRETVPLKRLVQARIWTIGLDEIFYYSQICIQYVKKSRTYCSRHGL